MVSMNLLSVGNTAGSVVAGSWGKKALADAAALGGYVPGSGKESAYTTMPAQDELEVRPGPRYLHVTSNETINGVRMVDFPDLGVPRVADMSSDYLARPIDWRLYDIV